MPSSAFCLLQSLFLIMLFAAIAHAQYMPIRIPEENCNMRMQDSVGGIHLKSTYVGRVDFGGVPFVVPAVGNYGWNAWKASGGTSRIIRIPVDMENVDEVHTLMMTYWGCRGPLSHASIEFVGANGTCYRKDLIGGVDVRDYNQNVWTNTINNTSTTQVIAWKAFGDGQRLDKQRFVLPEQFQYERLSYIRITDNGKDYSRTDRDNARAQRLLVGGITVHQADRRKEGAAHIDITWEPIVPLPEARYRAQCEVLNGRLYCIGGMSNYSALNTVAEYNGCEWTTMQVRMAVGRFEFASCILKDRLYVFGGQTGNKQVTESAESFDGKAWAPEGAMPAPLYDCAAAAVGDSIYLFGGLRNTSGLFDYCTKVWRFCPTAHQQWREVCELPARHATGDLPTRRIGYRCVTKESRIYVIGGGYVPSSFSKPNQREYYSDVWSFAPSANAATQWRREPSLYEGRADFACAYLGDDLYVVGGEPGGFQRQVEVLQTGKWSGYESTESFADPSFATLGNRIVAVGGVNGSRLCFATTGVTGTVQTLMKDLLAYYPLNGNGDDLSGNNRNANGTRADRFVNGPTPCAGKAYHIAGKGTELTLPSSINVTGNFSVSFWMRTRQHDPDNWPSGTFIIDRDLCGEASDWSIGLGGGSKLQFNTGVAGRDYVLTSSAVVNDSMWHHVVVLRDVTARTKAIYIDGRLDASSFFSGQPLLNNALPIYIGASVCLPPAHDFYVGDIDDMRIYGRALSGDEVRQLYGGTSQQAQK